MGSPAQLHLYDRRGRHVGPDTAGGVDLDIPGARYFTNPETGQQLIVIPHADLSNGYAVRVEGAGDGSFDLDLFYTDWPRRQAVRLAYADVALNPETLAELAIQAGDTHLLRVDDDGNGSFDLELPPSQVIQVAVFEISHVERTPWLGLLAVVVIGASLLTLSIGVVRRRRRPSSLPVTLCPRCGTRLRPTARFCQQCGSPLPAAVLVPLLPRPQTRRVSGRLVLTLSAMAVLSCFFLPWVDCPGLRASGWDIPGLVDVINLPVTPIALPGRLLYLVPLFAVVVLLFLSRAQRKIAAGLTILIGGTFLLLITWTILGLGVLACSRPGLWGTLIGLAGIMWGGTRKIRE